MRIPFCFRSTHYNGSESAFPSVKQEMTEANSLPFRKLLHFEHLPQSGSGDAPAGNFSQERGTNTQEEAERGIQERHTRLALFEQR